jgi:hypothetical protein
MKGWVCNHTEMLQSTLHDVLLTPSVNIRVLAITFRENCNLCQSSKDETQGMVCLLCSNTIKFIDSSMFSDTELCLQYMVLSHHIHCYENLKKACFYSKNMLTIKSSMM